MKSRVYFTGISDKDGLDARLAKFSRLLLVEDHFKFINKKDRVAIKIHFGEEGNTGFVKPPFARLVVDKLKEKGVTPFLTDTNVLYKGRRTFTEEHIKLAHEHGFTLYSVGAPVVIADDIKSGGVADINVNEAHVKTAKVAALFQDVNAIVSVAHFKGHLLAGFGGSLKNIGMGCASREGKLIQHSDKGFKLVVTSCTGCGACEKACPARAIMIIKGKASIDNSKCIGCAECIAVCPVEAIMPDWGMGELLVQEKMVEYAKAVIKGKPGKLIFINFAVKISKECDCFTENYPIISQDIGIFISSDPVSVDKASYDMVLKINGKDVFKDAHPDIDGSKQLLHASKIGLGSLDYELISI